MSDDRITEVRVSGMRCIDEVRLAVGPMTVMIGENGAGKSTLIEALELLRLAGEGRLVRAMYDQHLGLRALLRHGASKLSLGVSTTGPHAMRYDMTVGYDGGQMVVLDERLDLFVDLESAEPLHVIIRGAGVSRVFSQAEKKLVDIETKPSDLLLNAFGLLPPQAAIGRMVATLAAIDVQLPFSVGAKWAKDLNGRSTRNAVALRPVDSLDRFGLNIANAYYALRHEFGNSHWESTMDLVRLGLGYFVESVDASARDAGSDGLVVLALRDRRFVDPIPVSGLSDGQLSYLAFVALCRLNTGKSIVAFDEPELHLHPALLGRIVQLFEGLSDDVPVLLATHSNQLLDCLTDPVAAVVQCELDEHGAARWVRPDADEFERWRAHYAGFGEMRAAGVERLVLTREGAG